MCRTSAEGYGGQGADGTGFRQYSGVVVGDPSVVQRLSLEPGRAKAQPHGCLSEGDVAGWCL